LVAAPNAKGGDEESDDQCSAQLHMAFFVWVKMTLLFVLGNSSANRADCTEIIWQQEAGRGTACFSNGPDPVPWPN
jgi:hypothetical protein